MILHNNLSLTKLISCGHAQETQKTRAYCHNKMSPLEVLCPSDTHCDQAAFMGLPPGWAPVPGAGFNALLPPS